ncbi:MAG: glycosyltransferase family 39 protein [Chloroflexi bacterium]|nr:glycosyltransferase family 39 protein [Chloroflexota bacterium]
MRVWRLEDVPPGWRDDELINLLVLSQYILKGDWRPYYPDASGNEALYHALNGLFWWALGANVFGIRYLSVLFGTLNVALTYALGKRLFGRHVATFAAVGLALSFWSLMYSRFGLRQIAMPTFALLAFYALWRLVEGAGEQGSRGAGETNPQSAIRNPQSPFTIHNSQFTILLSLSLALGFYTYFAARGVPLVIIAFGGAAAVVAWPTMRGRLAPLALSLLLALLMAIPLIVSIRAQPGGDARVAELAAPITQAAEGDFALLGQHIWRTLAMFHADGDDEYLYNIPYRPVFGPLGAIFFWAGVAMAFWTAARPFIRRWRGGTPATHTELASGLLILWWLAGITPGFLSVPAASLGHTILAMPATYLLAAFPLVWLGRGAEGQRGRGGRENQHSSNFYLSTFVLLTLYLLLPLSIALRDLPDYFVGWANTGNVRLLYRADLGNIAEVVQADSALRDFGVTSLLPGPWDREALRLELGDTAASPRFFNSERVILYTPSQSFVGYPTNLPLLAAESYQRTGLWAGGYELATIAPPPLPEERLACFENGLCLRSLTYDPATGVVDGVWQVARPLILPPLPLIANPPPPDVDARPRLSVYAQLLDSNGQWLAGDDGLWVDVETLQPGDLFLQRHLLPPTADPSTTLRLGLYDPVTGQRLLTETGADGVTAPN